MRGFRKCLKTNHFVSQPPLFFVFFFILHLLLLRFSPVCLLTCHVSFIDFCTVSSCPSQQHIKARFYSSDLPARVEHLLYVRICCRPSWMRKYIKMGPSAHREPLGQRGNDSYAQIT